MRHLRQSAPTAGRRVQGVLLLAALLLVVADPLRDWLWMWGGTVLVLGAVMMVGLVVR